MRKRSSNKSVYILVIVIFVVSLFGLMAVTSTVSEEDESRANAERLQASQEAEREAQTQAKEKKHADCIAEANRLYIEYSAKIPADLTVEERLMATQTFGQMRDSQKADCDRWRE